MKIVVRFYAFLIDQFDNTAVHYFDLPIDSTISDLLKIIIEKFDKREIFYGQDDVLKEDIFILKNGRAIKFLEGLDTKLERDDEISILPPIAGG